MSKGWNVIMVVVSIIFGILIAKSGILDYILLEVSKLSIPSITIPENPLTSGLRLLLTLPSMNFIAYAIMVLLLNCLAWWIGGSGSARKIVMLDSILIIWGIFSYAIIEPREVQAYIQIPTSMLSTFTVVKKGRLKERREGLPPAYPEEPTEKGQPWTIEGLGTQGSFNAVSLLKAMAHIGGLPVNSVFIGISEEVEVEAADKALRAIKAGILDKLINIRKGLYLPPYIVSRPKAVSIGIGSPEEAIRYHVDVIDWVENEWLPWAKEHFAPNLIRCTGIGWTGLVYGTCRDALLSFESWAQRQYRVGYIHIANEPPRVLVNLKEFMIFANATGDGLLPTFDSIFISYEGRKPPSDEQWKALEWNWSGRLTREKAEIIHHIAFSIHSRAGVQPTLKEITLMAKLSPIKVIYVTEGVIPIPMKKSLFSKKVKGELNKDAIRSAVKTILYDLAQNGVRKEIVLTCFGQLTDGWRELIETTLEEEGVDVKVNIAGLRFGYNYSFIVGMGPVIARPCRWLDEPLGIWDGGSEENPIESLIPLPELSNPNSIQENTYYKVFNVYARHIGLKDAFDLFRWKGVSL